MEAITQRSSPAPARALAGNGGLPARAGSDDGEASGRAPQGRRPYGRSGADFRSGGIDRKQQARDESADEPLEELRAPSPAGEWSFSIGYEQVPDSVRALRLGAFDCLTEPREEERLDLVVAGAARGARAQRRLCEESRRRTRRYSPDSFVGHSAAARGLRELLTKLTEVPLSALVLTGETGTGKGLVARILHHAGPRAERPLIEVNCAALPRELLESELFGHEAGAFTGAKGRYRGLMEQANGGTLFLDEIGEMDLDLQSKLLKAIEDRAVRRLGGDQTIATDIQLIAATNHDLQALVREGRFRADLYHRLSVFCLELPPLRRRKEDLEDLVPLYVAEFNVEAAKNVKTIPDEVWRRLHAHDWPGNVARRRRALADRPQGADLCPDRRHSGRGHHLSARGIGRGAQLGLPLLLDPRRDTDARRSRVLGVSGKGSGAVKAVEDHGRQGPVERWRRLRDRIHDDVCRNGFDPERNALVQYYGGKSLDTALLMIPLVGFLPADDARVIGTFAAITRELVVDGLVRRYPPEAGVDGLAGDEGTFLACSFWLADVLCLMGRRAEARELFERLLALRNDVGLLAEEYDPRAGRQLGNFPQAFSHVGLITTAHNLTSFRGPAERRAQTWTPAWRG